MVFKKIDILNKSNLAHPFYKTIKNFATIAPVLFGIILLIGLFKIYVSTALIPSVFTGGLLKDTILGLAIGNISAGNPITSYILSGDLLKEFFVVILCVYLIIASMAQGKIIEVIEDKYIGLKEEDA